MTEVSPVSDAPEIPTAVEQTSDMRSRILSIDDIPVEIVSVPEWGDVEIEVRGMTGGDRSEMLADAAGNDGTIDFKSMYADVVIKTCFDPATGARIFRDEDRGPINSKAGVVVDRLAQVGMRLSGMGGDKAVEEAGKPS